MDIIPKYWKIDYFHKQKHVTETCNKENCHLKGACVIGNILKYAKTVCNDVLYEPKLP